MAQQINLYTPTLLTPLRHFSARAMLMALAVMAVGLSLLGLWMTGLANRTAADRQEILALQAQEQAQLTEALVRSRLRSDPAALEREMAEAQKQLVRLRARVQSLVQGQLPAGQSHSPLLQWLSNSTPAQSWLTELRVSPQQVQLVGATLEPAELTGWMAMLQDHPSMRGMAFAEIRIERLGQEAVLQQAGLSPREATPLRAASGSAVATWGFRISAERPSLGGQP